MDNISSNPALKNARNFALQTTETQQRIITPLGIANKTALLLSIVMISGFLTWTALLNEYLESIYVFQSVLVLLIGQFFIFAYARRNIENAKIPAIIYAVGEGYILGAISLFYEVKYPGVVFNTVFATVAAVFFMLFLYSTRLIRVSDKFKMLVGSATLAIAFTYLMAIALRIFGINLPLIHEANPAGIAFTTVVLGVALFNILADFRSIEDLVVAEASEKLEWFLSFGLLITIMWIYLEMLRLMSKLRKR